jgi:hypothetical protein
LVIEGSLGQRGGVVGAATIPGCKMLDVTPGLISRGRSATLTMDSR